MRNLENLNLKSATKNNYMNREAQIKNLEILYQIEHLIQYAILEHYDENLERGLELLNELIADIELNALEYNDDNETDIPEDYN